MREWRGREEGRGEERGEEREREGGDGHRVLRVGEGRDRLGGETEGW